MYRRLGLSANPFDPLGIPRHNRAVPYPISNRGFIERVRALLRKVVRDRDPYVTVVIGDVGQGKTSLLRFLEQEALKGRLLPGFEVMPAYVVAPQPAHPPELLLELLEEAVALRLREEGFNLSEVGWPIRLVRVKTPSSGRRRMLVRLEEGVEVEYISLFFSELTGFLKKLGYDCLLFLVDSLEDRVVHGGSEDRRREMGFLRRLIDGLSGPVYLVASFTTEGWSVVSREVDRALVRRFPAGSLYQVAVPRSYREFRELLEARLEAFRLHGGEGIHPISEDAARMLYHVYLSTGDIGRAMQLANLALHNAALRGASEVAPRDLLSASSEELEAEELLPMNYEVAGYKLAKALSLVGRRVSSSGGSATAEITVSDGGVSATLRVKVTACESAARLEHDADVHVVISPSAALGDRVIWIRLTPKLAYLLSSREDTSEEILDELGLMEALREWVRGAVSEGLIAPPAGSHRWLKRTIGALIELGGEASAARLREHVGVSEQALRSILAALGQMKLVEARGGRVRLKSSPALQRLYKLMLEKKTSTSRELRREFIATSSKTLQWHMDILRRLGLVDSTRVGNIARYSVRDCSYYEEWSRRIASKAELLSESELRELEEAASMAREAFKRSDAVEAGLMLRKASEALSELEEKAEGRSSALSLASELAKRVDGLKRELSSEPELLKLVEGAEASRKLADVLSQPPWRVSLEGVREVEQELAELERRAREALRALAAVRSFRLIPKAVGSLLSRGEAEEVEREAAEAVADILRGVPSEKVMERLYGSKGYRVFEELVATKLGELLGRVSDIENSLQLLAADHRLRALAKLSAVKRGVRELSEASLEDTTPEELLAEIKEVERELKELEEAVAEEVLSVVSRAVRGREVSRRELAEKLGAGEKTALAALSLLERAQLAEVVVRIKRV